MAVVGSQSGPGEVINRGTFQGGNGSAPDGAGGDVTITASPSIVLDGGVVRGGNGPNRGDIFLGTGDTTTGPPPRISIAGPGTLLDGGNLTISGGTLAVVALNGLGPGAINLSGRFFLALGPGGELALLDNNGLVFVAGQFFAFADTVTLPPGVTLDALVSGPVTLQGSFFYYDARLLLPGQVSGVPGSRVVIPALLLNLGPLADSYGLEGVFAPSAGVRAGGAWALADLPSIVAVPAGRTAIVPLTVTIPVDAVVGSRQALTVTATSYTDPAIMRRGQVVIAVRPGGALVYLSYVSLNGIPPVEPPRLQYLPQVYVGSPPPVAVAGAEPQRESELWQGWEVWLPLVGE